MARLTDPVKTLKGVGPAKEKLLETLNIFTLGDLPYPHSPRGYEDRTKMTCVAELNVDEPACFRATVMSAPRTAHIRKGLDLTRIQVADHSGRLTLTFFNSRFAAENLQYGREYIFYGTLTGDFTGYGMTNPLFESPDSQPVATRRTSCPSTPLPPGSPTPPWQSWLPRPWPSAIPQGNSPPEDTAEISHSSGGYGVPGHPHPPGCPGGGAGQAAAGI